VHGFISILIFCPEYSEIESGLILRLCKIHVNRLLMSIRRATSVIPMSPALNGTHWNDILKHGFRTSAIRNPQKTIGVASQKSLLSSNPMSQFAAPVIPDETA